MNYKILDSVNSVSDLKALSEKDMAPLCEELRGFLIENVERSGGHLASNLGAVEISVAIHRVFDSPKDHIIFDVGHQAYVHKILTGRKNAFSALREVGGLSGFTSRKESEHDPFGAGHSSTSLSAALGFAEADALNGVDAHTVCLIGDGAFTGGMIHEAINNCKPDLKLVIILNENRMSISKNRGSFASYLAKVRISKGYRRWKASTYSFLNRIPLLGKPLHKVLRAAKNKIKKLIYHQNYFEDLGFYYIGPVDGNNYADVSKALFEAKDLNGCVVIHTYTQKGKGYKPAEESPDGFHSIAPRMAEGKSLHSIFANALIERARDDKDVVAITAAMGIGTGLSAFEDAYPERYFDVGIAESHALTFAAGLAAAGKKPYCAIYSTFLQRGYDNIVHDIALQNLPVRMMIDRAELAVRDGATHHGIFDVSFLSHIPNISLFSPVTYGSLEKAIDMSLSFEGPVAIRYANKTQSEKVNARFYPDGDYSKFGVIADFNSGNLTEYVFVTYGNISERVIEAEDMLRSEGLSVGTVLVEKLKPYSESCEKIAKYIKSAKSILFVEEGIKNGGFSMIAKETLADGGHLSGKRVGIAAIDDNFAVPDKMCDIYDYLGLSSAKIAEKMKEMI